MTVTHLARSEYGSCPRCKQPGQILNVSRDHWAHCPEHKVRWHVGSNLFSGWREESQADWDQNEQTLLRCRVVTPANLELST